VKVQNIELILMKQKLFLMICFKEYLEFS